MYYYNCLQSETSLLYQFSKELKENYQVIVTENTILRLWNMFDDFALAVQVRDIKYVMSEVLVISIKNENQSSYKVAYIIQLV